MVAMADGTKLATDVYLPNGKGPFPAILLRTPYNKHGNRRTAALVARFGYALVVQDMRGRFASQGRPVIIFGNEGIGGTNRDGHDTLRWIAEQSWSDGQVITYGASALGIAQNMAAPGAPQALKGQVVSVAFSDYYHQAAYQGAYGGRNCSKVGSSKPKWKSAIFPRFSSTPRTTISGRVSMPKPTPTRSMRRACSPAAGTTFFCRERSIPF